MNPAPRKIVRFLADEFHSESWSLSAQRAAEFAREDPQSSSYSRAAKLLSERDFEVSRNLDSPLSAKLLADADVLALLHPCDPRWERTTSSSAPALAPEEIAAVLAWVRAGGGLLVVTEYEHDKYGDNLNDLLAPAGLRIENTRVFDRTACVPGNPEWLFAEPVHGSPLGHLASRACFYRAGSCAVTDGARAAWRASAEAHPAQACLIGCTELGRGRIVVVTDSLLFGDEHIGEHDHLQLWLNIVHWLAVPAYRRADDSALRVETRQPVASSPEWTRLKGIINTLRAIQEPDGSVGLANHDGAAKLTGAAVGEIRALTRHFPHEAEYLARLPEDFATWERDGFGRPDFAASLAAFRPEWNRRDGLGHLVVFPMYTPNASSAVRFEALLIRTAWPDWLAALEQARYPNPKFVPLSLVDFTDGYAGECAVLFPETVSVAGRATNHFGGIFCDREARRLQSTALRSADVTGLRLFPELECLLANRLLLGKVCALWDLIHDQSHALGELPFDPFMIRQRAPFWMYAIEELRVDVRAFGEAHRLAREGFPFARYVCWAIVLDRILRFPITGSRVRNYDALGGQIIFGALHQSDLVLWCDNHLEIRWDALPDAMAALDAEIHSLYKTGAECSRVALWLAAHEFVSRHVRPNVGSRWNPGALPDESDPKAWLAFAHDDEFPLGNFHLLLQRRLAETAR
ncbi:MAG: DUF6421 family protein [Chthoniobacteraceae bacterium]